MNDMLTLPILCFVNQQLTPQRMPTIQYHGFGCAARLPHLMPYKYVMDPGRVHGHMCSVEQIHLPSS